MLKKGRVTVPVGAARLLTRVEEREGNSSRGGSKEKHEVHLTVHCLCLSCMLPENIFALL